MATPRVAKQFNHQRITLESWVRAEGYDDAGLALGSYGENDGITALCSNGCVVRPGAHCEHGHPAPGVN